MGSKTRAAGRRIREGVFILPSPDEIEATKTPAGAWSAMQLAEWGVKWPPKAGWRRKLEARWNELHPRPTITCKDGGWFGLWLLSNNPTPPAMSEADATRPCGRCSGGGAPRDNQAMQDSTVIGCLRCYDTGEEPAMSKPDATAFAESSSPPWEG